MGKHSTLDEAADVAAQIAQRTAKQIDAAQILGEFSHLFEMSCTNPSDLSAADPKDFSAAKYFPAAVAEDAANRARVAEVVRASAAWANVNADAVEMRTLKEQWHKAQAYECSCGAVFPSASKFYAHVGMNKAGSC